MAYWRANCECQFVFDPATAVSEADENAVRAKFGARKVALMASLSSAPTELQVHRENLIIRTKALQPMLDQAAKKLAQAKSDLSLL